MGKSECKWCTARDFSFDGRAGCLDQCPCPTGKYSNDPLPDSDLTAVCASCPEGHRCARYSFHSDVVSNYSKSSLMRYVDCWTPRLGYNYREMTMYDSSISCAAVGTSSNNLGVVVPAADSSITGCLIGYISPVKGWGYRSDGDSDWTGENFVDGYFDDNDANLSWIFKENKENTSTPEVWSLMQVANPAGTWNSVTSANIDVKISKWICGSGDKCRPESVYCPAESTDAIVVPSGFFSVSAIGGEVQRRIGIEPCPVGHWCEAGNFTQCEPGKFATVTGATSCDMCAPGQYAGTWGRSSCDFCEEGYQCPRGSIQPVNCGCEAPRAKKMNELTTIDYDKSVTECPPGGWSPSIRPGDSYCPAKQGSPQYPPKGTYTSGGPEPYLRMELAKNEEGETHTAPTDDIKFRTALRQYSLKDDLPKDAEGNEFPCLVEQVGGLKCVTAEGLIQGAEFNKLKIANADGLTANIKLDLLVVKVNDGTFVKQHAGSVIEIGVTLDEKSGATQTVGECGVEKMCVEGSSILSVDMTFNGGLQRTLSLPCDSGYRCKQGTDYICLPGTFAPGERNSVCQSCPPGKFTESKGRDGCKHCPAGWFQNAPQQIQCERCATGQFADNITTALCDKCPAGYYAPDTTLTFCTACELGKYQVAESSRECKHCDAGKDSNNTRGLAEACVNCETGQYRPAANNGVDPACASRAYILSGANQYKAVSSYTNDETGLNEATKALENYTEELLACEVGYPLCMSCEAHSFGCGDYIKPLVGSDKNFASRVRYVKETAKPFTDCERDNGDVCLGFTLNGFDAANAEKKDPIFFDIELASLVESTLKNRSKFWTSGQCIRELGDEAKGSKCSTCKDGWISRDDRGACVDADRTGDLIAKMTPAEQWTITSSFAGVDGDAHTMKVSLIIPSTMDHMGLKIIHYQLEVSRSPDMSVLVRDEQDEPLGPRVDIPKSGDQFEFEFIFRLPDAMASLYEQSYFVRAFPVIEVNGRAKVVNVESNLDPAGRVLSEIFPKKKWSTIKECGGSDTVYLETRTEENSFPGVNVDDPIFENWKCTACPIGGTCRGDAESHWRTLVASYGFWRARNMSVSTFSMDDTLYIGRVAFYPCPKRWSCLGRKNAELLERGWGRKNATYMNSRSPCCDWGFAGECGAEYEVMNDEGIYVKEIARCEKNMYFKSGCSEICRVGVVEEAQWFSSEKIEAQGEICEENPICSPPDPAGIDHAEKCMDGYVGLTCGNCYDPKSDPTDQCSTDANYTQPGVGVGGKIEDLSCERRKYFMKKEGCVVCPPPRFQMDLWVMFVAFFSIVAVVYCLWKVVLKRAYRATVRYKDLINDLRDTLKMLLDFMQVLNSISAVISIDFPPMLEGFLDIFSGFISFDIKVLMGMPCVDVGGDGITKYGQEVAIPFIISFLLLILFVINVFRGKSLCPKFCGGRIVVIKKEKKKGNALKRKSMAVIRDMQKGTFNAHARHSRENASTGRGLAALSQTFGNGIFDKEDPPAVQKGVKDMWYATVLYVYTILTFYHVPITSASFNMFKCETIEGKDYLNMDYNIQCWQSRHYIGMMAAGIVIGGYIIGLPLGWALMLYRNRKHLHHPDMVRFAGHTYADFYPHAQWYWTGIIDQGRKLILSGALIVLYRQPVMQITIAIIYCSGLLVLLQHVRPMRKTSMTWMTTVEWLGITLIYSVPLTKEAIKSSPTPGEQTQAILVDYYCMGIVYFTFTSLILMTFIQMRLTWETLKDLEGVSKFDANQYAWLYMNEKQLKSKAAVEASEKAKKSHVRKSIFQRGKEALAWLDADIEKDGGGKIGGEKAVAIAKKPRKPKRGLSFRKKKAVVVAPAKVDDDPFGLAGYLSEVGRPNVTANNSKLPSHLVKRIQSRRGRRDSMAKDDTKRREQGNKLMRRKSFDASSMASFAPKKEEKPNSSKKKSKKAKGGLNRRPSQKMIAMTNDFAQQSSAGDLMIVQPRRHLLGRSKFKKLDPDAEERVLAKREAKELKAKKKKDVEENRFKVFLTAAVNKGYFGDLEQESEEYQAKYDKLVQKYKAKYASVAKQDSSSSESEDEETSALKEEPRAIMLKTDLPVVNAFGKAGADLKSALLTSGKLPRYESDTMQEV